MQPLKQGRGLYPSTTKEPAYVHCTGAEKPERAGNACLPVCYGASLRRPLYAHPGACHRGVRFHHHRAAFLQKDGCEGFSQFKWKLKEEGGTNARDKDIPDSLSELQTFFWRVGTPAYQEKLENAAAIIARMERIFMVGIGNSGSIASYGARYFSNLGKFALCVSDPFYPITLARFCDLTLPYYTTMRRSEAENYDYSSQIPAVYLLESLARRVHNRLNE